MSKLRFATMKNLLRGRVRLALLALCLLGGAQGAGAVCLKHSTFKPRSINMSMGTVVIPENQPIGLIGTPKRFSLGASEIMWDCVQAGQTHGVMLQGTPTPSDPTVYTTNVTGVGIRLSRFISGGGIRPDTLVTYPHDLSYAANTTVTLFQDSYFQVELLKIGPITGNGPLAVGTYTTYSGDDGISLITTELSGLGITVITPSCTVDTGSRNISVPLGNVALSRFGGIGTTAGDRPFKIQLNCQPGQNAQNLVYLRMDATQDPATGAPGVLKITGGTDIAGGVGIQVVDKDAAPVAFGEDVLVGPSKDGAYVLPYTARYYQSGSTVTAGRADGTATFTLSYK